LGENEKYKIAKAGINKLHSEIIELLKKEFTKYKELNKSNKINV